MLQDETNKKLAGDGLTATVTATVDALQSSGRRRLKQAGSMVTFVMVVPVSPLMMLANVIGTLQAAAFAVGGPAHCCCPGPWPALACGLH